jgi:hypothetical protein
LTQAVATLVAGIVVALVWRRDLPLPIRAATLGAATLVAIPVALIYDLMLAGVAAAWLLRDPTGLAGWEKVVLAALFMLSIVPPGLAEVLHFPTGPIATLSLLALTAGRGLLGFPATQTATA